MTIADLGVSWHCATPHGTAITSVAAPFSLSLTASSTAISSNGLMFISTLAMSTLLPSDLTRTWQF